MAMVKAESSYRLSPILRVATNSTKWLANKFPRSNLIRKIYHGCRNWYEGGWPIWTGGNYSYVPSLIQDARWDQNYVTRREMMRRMRYWSQNSAICEGVISCGERYTVGASGLHVSVYPNDDLTADAEDTWYDRAEQVIAEWFQDCGWNGETMEKLLKIGYRDQVVDGEIFYIKTRKRGMVDYNGRSITVMKPCLQMVEAHRVETPWQQFDDYKLIDGVQFAVVFVGDGPEKRDLLQKVGYWVRNGMGSFEQNDSWNMISADNIFHIYNSHRANQYRGLSDFYPCVMDLHKMEDLLEIELKAQASQSVRAVVVTNNSGQATSPLDKKLEMIKVSQGVKPQPNNQSQTEFNQWTELFRKETGAYVYGQKTGESVENLAPCRPSDATLQLWEFLVNSVCAATKRPRCLVFQKISGQSARSQGTEVRAELDNADLFFKGDFQKWRNFVLSSVVWFLEWAVKNDIRVSDPPSDWKQCLHILQPEACNVDVGYTTQSQLMLLAAGAMDYEMILGPQGTSFMTVAKRLLRQQKWMEKKGLKVSLPALLPGQIQLDGKQEKETVEA